MHNVNNEVFCELWIRVLPLVDWRTLKGVRDHDDDWTNREAINHTLTWES